MSKEIVDNIDTFTLGSSLIYDERLRQCLKGFDGPHDEQHEDGSLLLAAMDILVGVAANEDGHVPDRPEWVEDYVERMNKKYLRAPIRRLVIASALIVAEIERLEKLSLIRPPA